MLKNREKSVYVTVHIWRELSAFNKSFGILFRKFYALNVEPFFNLFQSFCTSFYGANLWVNRKKFLNVFKNLSVSYHIALKKMDEYDVRNILENDFDAILARVSFIQNREPSSFYVAYPTILLTNNCK